MKLKLKIEDKVYVLTELTIKQERLARSLTKDGSQHDFFMETLRQRIESINGEKDPVKLNSLFEEMTVTHANIISEQLLKQKEEVVKKVTLEQVY